MKGTLGGSQIGNMAYRTADGRKHLLAAFRQQSVVRIFRNPACRSGQHRNEVTHREHLVVGDVDAGVFISPRGGVNRLIAAARFQANFVRARVVGDIRQRGEVSAPTEFAVAPVTQGGGAPADFGMALLSDHLDPNQVIRNAIQQASAKQRGGVALVQLGVDLDREFALRGMKLNRVGLRSPNIAWTGRPARRRR